MPKSIGIVGVGSYLPEKVMTNFDLEKMVVTSDEWIYAKTGIKERRIASKEEMTSDLATKAGKEAIDSAGIKPEEIDLIIVATSSPDMVQPSTACLVQYKMGINNDSTAFDLLAACSGFTYVLSLAIDIMRGNSSYKTVLVIGADCYSKILNWTDRTSCVFFGDGAGAVVLREVPEGYGLLSSYLGSDGRGWDAIQLAAGGCSVPINHETVDKKLHAFRMDGRKVWEFATNVFPKAIRKALKKCTLTPDDIDLVISHQANINIIKAGMQALGLSIDKAFSNLEKYANTAAASIPIALDEAVKLGKLRKGDILVTIGFGGGLTWGANVLRWSL